MRVCGLFVRAAQLDFEWALCTQGMCRGGDSHFFPFLPSSLLSGFLWLSLEAAVSGAELGGGREEGAQQVLVVLKASSEDIAPVGGKAQFAEVRSNREEKFTLETKTSAFTIGGGQVQENSSRVRLRAPSSVWVAQSPGLASGRQEAKGTGLVLRAQT